MTGLPPGPEISSCLAGGIPATIKMPGISDHQALGVIKSSIILI